VQVRAVHDHEPVLFDLVAFDNVLALDFPVNGTNQVLLEALMAVSVQLVEGDLVRLVQRRVNANGDSEE
jgi:hypothetical protein